MSLLNSKRRAATSGKATSLVVFVHGYGADGADLIGLADPLAQHMPDTVFIAPDAPNPCKMSPMGREWFPIPWIDGSSETEAMQGMENAVKLFDQWMDETLRAEGMTADRTLLLGFSQGTMISLHVAPRRSDTLAGVVGFSGQLLAPERLAAEVISKPPVLLIHGDQDDVVPFNALAQAADGLTEAGIAVYTHVSKGTGHGIAPDGLSQALQFMQRRLAPGASSPRHQRPAAG